jgi:hypothetical protein
MATAKSVTELRRWGDLAVVRRALKVRMPEFGDCDVGLRQVAELCRRDSRARPRDCINMRDEMLMIGCDWDLARDRLEDQSDGCLQRVADFLR